MKDITIPIDQAGRIVLPKDIRQELAILPGDTLMVSVQGSSVTLTPNKKSGGLVRKGRALVFASPDAEKLTAETVSSILEGVRASREEPSLAGLRHPKRKA